MTHPLVPMVLIHGFAQTPASWGPVVDLLGATRQLEIPELPGHGSTALSEGTPTPESARAVVARSCASLGRPAAVWGYSQGARVALDLALNHPESVAALILESGSAGMDDPAARAARREHDLDLSRRIEAEPIEQFVAQWERNPALGVQSPEVIAAQRADRLAHDPSALAAALRGIGQAAYEPMWDLLGEIDSPVLLLTGSSDHKYAAHAERMADAVRFATSVSVDGAGHAVHIERPEAAVAAVIEFLSRLDGLGP